MASSKDGDNILSLTNSKLAHIEKKLIGFVKDIQKLRAAQAKAKKPKKAKKKVVAIKVGKKKVSKSKSKSKKKTGKKTNAKVIQINRGKSKGK